MTVLLWPDRMSENKFHSEMLKIQSRFRTKWVILGQSRTICGNVAIRKSQRLDKVEFILYIYMTIDNYDGGFFRYRDRLTNRSHDCQAIQNVFAIQS